MKALSGLRLGSKENLRVAAYCRISFDEEQEEVGSYETQKEFFEREIRAHEGWQFAGVYGDYARTGTQVEGRYGFKKLMRRAEGGTIDYILSKSISRFSRSVMDTLTYLRQLKALGIGVYFLEQGLDTMSMGGEIILTTLATIAEMESQSISDNILATFDGMNAKGTPLRRAAYGYQRKGKEWVVVPQQAIRVKLAYLMAANGYTFTEIANRLNQFEEMDRSGRKWDVPMVKRVLTSESYVGDILTNKTVRTQGDRGERRWVENDKQKNQYFIDNHHDALVGRRLWNKVTKMAEDRELAGQSNFHGVDDVREMARHDHMLDEVRKFIPRKPGKWMATKQSS